MQRLSFIKWLLLIWLCLEIASFVWVAEWLGLGWMLLLLIGSMILGFALLRREGINNANLMMRKMRSGEKIQPEDIADTPFVMFGALLFIIPGFCSDVVGVLCFLPPMRRWLVRLLTRKSAPKASNQQRVNQGKTYEGDYDKND